ncbi:phage tail sheath family protein [Primorskyibacter sp. 2E233]|uniref:phage tail sheath family protein n=1 Tax=Primorskyibacter sp. 2E233 TaxID=3413431 RepID=UPI003BF3146B
MAINPTYPGVYVQEVDSGVRTLAGVPTSIAAFVGRTKKGPVDAPTACFNYGEFTRRFGGLDINSTVSYAVEDFFANGGGQCEIVRLYTPEAEDNDGYAAFDHGSLKVRAASPGSWGNSLTAEITYPKDSDPEGAKAVAQRYGVSEDDLFDLTIVDSATNAREVYRNLSVKEDAGEIRYDRQIEGSSLISFTPDGDGLAQFDNARPAKTAVDTPIEADGGSDGIALSEATYLGDPDKKTGIHALRKADIFNLLCIPPDQRDGDLLKSVREAAVKLCSEERALLIVDPLKAWDKNPAEAASKVKTDQLNADDQVLSLTYADYAALYFPRLRKRDRLRGGQVDTFPPCGVVAGVMARTDVNRGVFKAPAGLGATISGVDGLTVNLTDNENGLLNPIGVNCLRSFPNIGRVVWGARTLKGSDQLSHDYKYVSVRRLALFIEESLFRGTQWVVFEGNDEPLWAQIRLSVGSFMQRLFLQGAFQGASPKEAYFVKCDAETTTQDDINRGIVNISVGFAPLQPAEFVMISIQQIRSAS